MAVQELDCLPQAWRFLGKPCGDARIAALATLGRLLLLLVAYFGLHVLLRGWVSETAGIDDVDQILRAQVWSWGYGPQPPLYTWLMRAFLGLFGYNIFAVTLLRESLLLASSILAYAIAQQLTRSYTCGLAAAAALQLLPSFSWESHRELTNTILASTLVLASLHSFLRLRTVSWPAYALFGLICGLGVLSKLNFLFVFLGLLAAALSLEALRPLVLNRKMGMAVLIIVVLCAPYVAWVWRHPDLAFSSMYKLKIQASQPWWPTVCAGLKKWSIVAVAHTAPLVGAFALLCGRTTRRWAVRSEEQRLLWRMLLCIAGLVTATILVFKVTGFRDRYVQPLFVWLPVLLVSVAQPELSLKRWKAVVGLGGAVAGVVLVLAPGRLLLTERLKKNELLNAPFRAFASDLQPAMQGATCIIAENHAVGGNLRLWFPDKLVIDSEVAPLFPLSCKDFVLAWDATRSPTPPPRLLAFAASLGAGAPAGRVWRFEEPLKYHHSRTMCLGAAPLSNAQGGLRAQGPPCAVGSCAAPGPP